MCLWADMWQLSMPSPTCLLTHWWYIHNHRYSSIRSWIHLHFFIISQLQKYSNNSTSSNNPIYINRSRRINRFSVVVLFRGKVHGKKTKFGCYTIRLTPLGYNYVVAPPVLLLLQTICSLTGLDWTLWIWSEVFALYSYIKPLFLDC